MAEKWGDASVFDAAHNKALRDALYASQTEVAGPINTATPDRSDDALVEENRRLREALEQLGMAYENWDPDATFATTALSEVAAKARAALKGDGL